MPEGKQNLVRMGDFFTTKVAGCSLDAVVGGGFGLMQKFTSVTLDDLLSGEKRAVCDDLGDKKAFLEVDETGSVTCVEPSCEFSSVNRHR